MKNGRGDEVLSFCFESQFIRSLRRRRKRKRASALPPPSFDLEERGGGKRRQHLSSQGRDKRKTFSRESAAVSTLVLCYIEVKELAQKNSDRLFGQTGLKEVGVGSGVGGGAQKKKCLQ